jgi:hypothetical protein
LLDLALTWHDNPASAVPGFGYRGDPAERFDRDLGLATDRQRKSTRLGFTGSAHVPRTFPDLLAALMLMVEAQVESAGTP